MESNSVIAVIGFIIIFTLLASLITRQNNQSYDNAYGYVKYTTSRDIARNAIEVMLRKIDTLSSIPATFNVARNINKETYNVDGTRLTDTSLTLTSRSRFH